MSKMAAFFAGLGSGYLKADRQRFEDERQAKLDAQNQQLYDAKMQDILTAQSERKREQDYRDANVAATSGGKTDAGYQVTDAAGSNAFTKDADAAAVLSDMASTKNTDVQTNDAARVSTGRTGATMQGTVAGNQVFTDPAKAQEFANTQNMGDYAKLKARQDVAEQWGKMDVADDVKAKLHKMESEGAFAALAKARTGDYAGATETWNNTGSSRLPEGASFVQREVVDPQSKQARNVISIVGKDGKMIVEDADTALRSYLSPSDQYKVASDDRKFAIDEQKAKADILHSQAQAKQAEAMAGWYASNKGKAGGGTTSSGSGGGASSIPGVALKDRRDYLSDFSGSLPDPKTAATPEEAQTISAGNQRVLAQADTVFSTNAELGNILTAPQAAAAMRLAQNPENIKRVRDNNTGIVYETVDVNGKPVILGVGSMKPPVKTPSQSAPATAAPAEKPVVNMKAVVADKYPHAGYETVQGVIDGAKRGDQKAIAYIEQIQNSGLPIQQREQIKNILSGK